jgi:hypothetical protein
MRIDRHMFAIPWSRDRTPATSGNAPMPPARPRTVTLAALAVTLALAGCVSVRETMIERGFPPAYADGYADGCSSGDEAAGGLFYDTRKDTTRYSTDRQYAQGWDSGFRQCKSEMAETIESDREQSGYNNHH